MHPLPPRPRHLFPGLTAASRVEAPEAAQRLGPNASSHPARNRLMVLPVMATLVVDIPEVKMTALPKPFYSRLHSALLAAGREDLARELEAYKPVEALTTGQAAELLGVSSPNTVKNWLKGGSFPGAFQTPGGHWRFPRDEVEAIR